MRPGSAWEASSASVHCPGSTIVGPTPPSSEEMGLRRSGSPRCLRSRSSLPEPQTMRSNVRALPVMCTPGCRRDSRPPGCPRSGLQNRPASLIATVFARAIGVDESVLTDAMPPGPCPATRMWREAGAREVKRARAGPVRRTNGTGRLTFSGPDGGPCPNAPDRLPWCLQPCRGDAGPCGPDGSHRSSWRSQRWSSAGWLTAQPSPSARPRRPPG